MHAAPSDSKISYDRSTTPPPPAQCSLITKHSYDPPPHTPHTHPTPLIHTPTPLIHTPSPETLLPIPYFTPPRYLLPLSRLCVCNKHTSILYTVLQNKTNTVIRILFVKRHWVSAAEPKPNFLIGSGSFISKKGTVVF